MERNKRILKLGLVCLIGILLISIGVSFFIRIKDPVFLKTYSERRTWIYPDGGHFETLDYSLYYITNIDDNRRVVKMVLNDYPDIDVQMNDRFYFQDMFNRKSHNHNDRVVGRYRVKEAFFIMDINNLDRDFDSLELNKARIYLDNGDTLDVDLGKIIIYNEKNSEEHVESTGGGSSSGNEGYSSDTTKYIRQDISLIKLDSPLLEGLGGLLEINFNKNYNDEVKYMDIEGMSFKAGDRLSVHSQFPTPEDIEKKYTRYDISPRLYYQDIDGNVFNTTIHHVVDNYEMPVFNFREILKYLKSRGEI